MLITSITAATLQAQQNKDDQENGKESTGLHVDRLWILLTVFAIEVFIAILAIVLAFKCGKNRGSTFIHVVVAIFFPPLYIFYALVSGCTKSNIKSKKN